MGLVEHLREEVAELYDSLIYETSENVGEEAADVLVILLALCTAEGRNLDVDFQKKMAKNTRRTWQKPDGKGVIRHKPTTATEALIRTQHGEDPEDWI